MEMIVRKVGIMRIVKNIRILVAMAFAMTASVAIAGMTAMNSSFESLEAEIQLAEYDQLPVLEHRVARMMQEQPQSERAQYLMSSLLLRLFLSDPTNTDLIKQSADLAAQAYELNSKSELGIVALANVLSVTGDTAKGIALLSEVKKKKIDLSWRYHLAMATLLTAEQGSPDVAKELLSAFLDPSANRTIIAPYIIATLSTHLEGQPLIAELRKWHSKFPCQDFKLAIAQMESRAGNLKQALVLYREVIKENPDNAEAQLGEGFTLLKSGKNYDAAALSLNKAIQLRLPSHLKNEAKLSYAVALIRAGKLKEGAKEAADAIASSPNAEGATLLVADEFNKLKRYDATIVFLDALDQTAPGVSVSYALRGEVFNTKLKNNARAVHAFSDAIVLDKSRATYYNGRGLAYYGLNKVESALSDFETAARIDPSDASARYNTACALSLLGRKNEALEALASALDLDERLTKQALADNDFEILRSTNEFQSITDRSKSAPVVAH